MTTRVGTPASGGAPPESVGAPSARGLWALGFVVLSLAALVAVPTYFGRRVAEVQSEIADVLDPAAQLSSNLRLLKSRQMARMEGFLATQEPVFRIGYNAAIAEEDSVLAELGGLGRALGLDVAERVARLSTESTDWRFSNQSIFEIGVDAGARDRVLAGYEDLQSATRELDLLIQAKVDDGRRRMSYELRTQSRIMFGLAVVALLATLIVARVAYRYRALTVEREKRRREAVQARREVDALLEATDDGVLGIDLDGRCISLNRAGEQLVDYREREIENRDVHETLFHTRPDGSPAPREESLLLAAVAGGKPLESDEDAIMWRRKRVAFPVRWALRPMIDGLDLRGAVLTFTDMTEALARQKALRRAIKQREDVVSIVSHDLRNPLGVTLAAADLLLDLPLDEDQRRRQAEIIRRSGERMHRLIDDLLDVSRIEEGALVVRLSQEDLQPILEEAREHFAHQADARGIRLTCDAPSGETRARVDRDRIMQALSNLLDNAIRLTREGGLVRLSATEDGDDVLVSVTDTGPGVAPELMETLFDRFAQSEGRDRGAAGLGLTIVRGVAVAHGGDLWVDSRLGQGSSFTLRLPKEGPAPNGEGALA
ncbi:MAG: ATP-binding protein [Gemmatimonadota bacterium]|nr:ATP-binding protein [Gemmatimonadota bacterium]